jgi:hypothetical protein
MKIEDGYILFDHLSQPSSSVVGEKEQIKAKTPSFVSSNAKGRVRTVEDLTAVESLGKSASIQLKEMFN